MELRTHVQDSSASSFPPSSPSEQQSLPALSYADLKDEKHKTPALDQVQVFLRHHCLMILYSAVGIGILVVLFYLSFFAATIDEDGLSENHSEFIGCRSWAFGDNCGLNGVDCLPFETNWTSFRCPARCSLDQSSALAVYGSGPYRADSRICRAAIHSGVIGSNGGCALLRFAGSANAFYSSSANGVSTIEYLSWFPKTIEFKAASSLLCTDLSWTILAVGIIFFCGYALLPRTNPAVLFYILVAWGFFYVRIIGQSSGVNYSAIVIDSFGEVLVLLAVSRFIYYLAPGYTFSEWETYALKRRVLMWSVSYVLPYHILLNMTLIAYIPWLNVDLGGYEENNTNAGTYVVYIGIGLLGAFCGLWLLRQLYRVGLWRKYLLLYLLVVVYALITWAFFNSTDFHLHHTMLGALLLPVTRFSTPLAALTQSVALGLFVQGYAAWGWSSYLDTRSTYLTIDVPESQPVVLNVTATTVNVSWDPLDQVDAYSLRLNQVEVYRGFETTAVISNLQPNMTYFLTVAGVADYGTNGQDGPESNFTTLLP